MSDSLDAVRFDALRNALYHKARQRALDTVSRLFNFLVVVLGTATAAALVKDYGVPDSKLGAVTAVIGALQLVYDPSGRARTHEFLQRRFYDVLAEIDEATGEPSGSQLASWRGALTRIYGDEPPTLRALDAISYNDAGDALGCPPEDRLEIRWWHSLFRNVLAFNSTHFETRAEKQRRTRHPLTAS